ncbi:MAG: sigma-54 dependent transcriptional regulator [Bacteroidota bacterium]
MRVIIIEDEKTKRVTLRDALAKAGHTVESFDHPGPALQYFEAHGSDAVVCDIRLPGMDGLEVLRHVKAMNQETGIILMTAYATVESAIAAMKQGAYDYITKPFSDERLLLVLDKWQQVRALSEENKALKKKLDQRYAFHNLVGGSKVMQELFDQIEIVAKTDATVLLQGESGTGKELVANALHFNSPRRHHPFIKLSCASLNEALLESELFGHEPGAFTGALQEHIGWFEKAQGGTLFLDDVDDIPGTCQIRLLRVLQEREITRVGGTTPIRINIRLLCASKTNLGTRAAEGLFREDLYYRLAVVPIHLPPLRDRKEDIPLLVNSFLKSAGRSDLELSSEAMGSLFRYDWPGNVRQLQNTVQRIIALATAPLVTREELPPEILGPGPRRTPKTFHAESSIDLERMVDDLLTSTVRWAMDKAGGNQSEAAQLVHLSRTTFRDMLKKYGSH